MSHFSYLRFVGDVVIMSSNTEESRQMMQNVNEVFRRTNLDKTKLMRDDDNMHIRK